jgi:hypothetical protein
LEMKVNTSTIYHQAALLWYVNYLE